MKDERLYLVHVAEALRLILEYTADGKIAFMGDRKTQDAVTRKFEVIGEATKRLSDEMRGRAPDIPWSRMARFRDILIHQYDRVDATETWRVIEDHVEGLLRQVEELLRRLDLDAS